MITKKMTLVALVLLLGTVAGMVHAQDHASPFRLVGSDAVQPAGADEIGDVEADPDEPAIPMVNRLDLRYGQLVMSGDTPITLETTAGHSIEIPAGYLAFAVQVGGDLSAIGPGWEVVLLIDSREGGMGNEALPQFTTDFELFSRFDEEMVVGLREFEGEAGFQDIPSADEVTGGLLSVIPSGDGRDETLISDGAWAMLPFELLNAENIRLRIETRRVLPPTDDEENTTVVMADQWPDAGWFNYSEANGWTAETVNVLEGLDARVSCQITAVGVVNVRNVPSLNGMRVRQIQAGETATVVSQTVGQDGFVWWRLRDGNWVRSDVVRAEASCRDLPRIEP
ncbi:MAG: SH3 domain-containing protein [Anaerolineae bacterium]|nr:SH3 domain-containing protein [Anaerolineae bacterium]